MKNVKIDVVTDSIKDKNLKVVFYKFYLVHSWIRCPKCHLTQIWVGFLRARFEVGGKITLGIKLVRIMLETWHLVRKFTHIYSFRKYTFQYQGSHNFVDIRMFFVKSEHFLVKMVPLFKAIAWECVRDFLVLFSLFIRWKVAVTENVSFTGYASGIQIPDCSKSAINQKNNNDVKISDMTSLSNFFDVVLFLLSGLVTGPSFMSTSSLVLEFWQFSFIRDWLEIRKLEIPPSEFCQITGDWGELQIPT